MAIITTEEKAAAVMEFLCLPLFFVLLPLPGLISLCLLSFLFFSNIYIFFHCFLAHCHHGDIVVCCHSKGHDFSSVFLLVCKIIGDWSSVNLPATLEALFALLHKDLPVV